MHRGEVRGDRGCEVPGAHLLVLEREMDDTIGARSRLTQPVKVIKVTSTHRPAERGQDRRSSVGSRKTDHVVSRSEELGDDRRAEMAGRAGDENTHADSLRRDERVAETG